MAETAGKLRVFISYARRDCSAFAEELLAGLEVAGFDAVLDRHDIAAGEDWEARLGGLIQAADTVVFALSPAAVGSERCGWEVTRAQALAKRIIPIVAIDVPEADTPDALKRLNYIYFSEGHSFARALGDLAKALRTDLDWVREHTRLGETAARWRERGESDVMLLRGSELEAARAWLETWRDGAPEPTDLHRAYLNASVEAEDSRTRAERQRLEELAAAQTAREQAFRDLSRRTTLGLIGGGVLGAGALAATAWGVLQQRERNQAEAAQREAEARSVEAFVAREAARTDVRGQVSVISGFRRGGARTEDARSPYSAALLQELGKPDLSLLQAIERTNTQIHLPQNLSSTMNGGLYLGRQSENQKREAIVVSQDDILGRRLEAPRADAEAWAAALSSFGFSVNRLVNPTTAALQAALTSAPGAAQAGVLRLLYVAAGGVIVDSESCLMSADSSIADRQAVQTTCVGVSFAERSLEAGAAMSVLILDTWFLDFRFAPL